MDDTLTGPTGRASGQQVLTSLIRVVAKANGVDESQAEARIRRTFDPDREPVDRYYAVLGIRPEALWDDLLAWLRIEVQAHPDAVEAVRRLHGRGFRLFPATTNGSLMCRLKLTIAGLGTREGSPYFERLLGGSEVHPQGKTGPWFFESLLEKIGLEADEVVMVGDDLQADGWSALQAGIRQVALVRRHQVPAWLPGPDGLIFINRLTVLPELVGRRDRRSGNECPSRPGDPDAA